jgi:hypothetical protein
LIDLGVATTGDQRLDRGANGSMPLSLQVAMSEARRAQFWAPSSWPANSEFLRFKARGLMRFSTGLESICDPAIVEIEAEPLPMIGKIGERLAHIGLGRQPLALGADKGFEFDDQRFGALLADGAALFGGSAAGRPPL